MLPASNRGAGESIGFPDVCNTPAGPTTVPIPYPNIATNAQATGFSETVKFSMVNALNLGSKIPMTSGDEAGTAGATKGEGAYTSGNPVVNVDRLPAICLACPTTGNNMNNTVGAVLVPSAVNVTLCRAGGDDRLDANELALLGAELRDAGIAADRRGSLGFVQIGSFAAGIAVEVHRKIAGLGADLEALVLDLRKSPGGELDAAARLAASFLADGAVVATVTEGDGDRTSLVAAGPPRSTLPLVLVVDRGTASAAELFAAALQANARALVVGEPTYGKRVAHRLVGATRVASATWTAGPAARVAPVTPDLVVGEGEDSLAIATGLARELAAAI